MTKPKKFRNAAGLRPNETLSDDYIADFVKNVPNDWKYHRITVGVYVRRYKDDTVKFVARGLVDKKRLFSAHDNFKDAVDAYNRFIDAHPRESEKFKDITGQKFGHLEVIRQGHRDRKFTYWECRCDLDGNMIEVAAPNLLNGNQTTCGKHGAERTELAHDAVRRDVEKYGTVPGMLTQKKRKSNTSGVKGISVITTKTGAKRYRAELSVGGNRYKGHRYERLADAVAERKGMEKKYQQPILDKVEQDKQSD